MTGQTRGRLILLVAQVALLTVGWSLFGLNFILAALGGGAVGLTYLLWYRRNRSKRRQ